MLTHHIQFATHFLTGSNLFITPLKVTMALHFYAHGTCMQLVGDTIGVHRSTAARAVDAVTDFLCAHVQDYVSMPMDR